MLIGGAAAENHDLENLLRNKPSLVIGVARLVFQDGHGASRLGLEPQGRLDAANEALPGPSG